MPLMRSRGSAAVPIPIYVDPRQRVVILCSAITGCDAHGTDIMFKNSTYRLLSVTASW